MRSDLVPGGRMDDLELPDIDGHPRRLSALAAGDPLVLHFYRGWWCPKERAFFRNLLHLQDEMEVAYTRMISVSVDATETAAAFRAGLDARWLFLSDAGRRYADALDLVEHTDTEHHPYVPTVFTLHPDLTIHAVYNGYWFWGRPTNEQLRADLRAITQLIRPDWEVPRP